MNGISLIIMGLWLIGTGWHANTSAAFEDVMKQTPFLPWLIAVVILWGLYQIDTLKAPVKAIVTLAALAVLLKQWPNIEQSIAALEHKGATSGATSP